MKVLTLSLIEHDGDLSRKSNGMWVSSAWRVSPISANALVGGYILFHEKQTAESHFGGIITKWEISEAWPDRVDFYFTPEMRFKGIRCQGKWGREQCTWLIESPVN